MKEILNRKQRWKKVLKHFIKILVLVPNIFVHVVSSCGINHQLLSVTVVCTNFVRKKLLICALLVSKASMKLKGFVQHVTQTLNLEKFPKCAKANKMSFPKKPDALKNLTPLEERLILPRIPFMQVRELPSGGQLSIHGNVVNVPADVNSTVNVLPRPINESQTIPIKLKCRMSYKHHYQFQNVRPSKVLKAAQYLV